MELATDKDSLRKEVWRWSPKKQRGNGREVNKRTDLLDICVLVLSLEETDGRGGLAVPCISATPPN